MRVLIIDNYDSYTFNLAQLAARTYGRQPVVLTHDDPRLTREWMAEFEAIMLSPGPGMPQRAGDVGTHIEEVLASGLPVLGVCLGHQVLAHQRGVRVGPAPQPRHGHRSRLRHCGTGLFAGLPQGMQVVRYHSHAVHEPLPDGLVADARAEDDVVMALHDQGAPWWGVQFHPESICSEHGAQLLANFRDLAGHGAALGTPPPPTTRPATIRPTPTGTVPSRLITQRLEGLPNPGWLFERLCAHATHAFWLDSSRVMPGYSRFSYIGFSDPDDGEVLTANVADGSFEVRRPCGEVIERAHSPALKAMQNRIAGRAHAHDPHLPFALQGGFVGWFGYELRHQLIPAANRPRKASTDDVAQVSADRYVVLDHETGQAWVVADPAAGGTETARQWVQQAEAIVADGIREKTGPATQPVPLAAPGGEPEPHLRNERVAYTAQVRECLEALRAGESYEICLTNELAMPAPSDAAADSTPWAAYLAQRQHNPAPYAAYLRFGDVHVASSSPERFLTVDADGGAESKPIKGTAPRHANAADDAAARRALAEDAKTFAENLMIVDLVRNDLGRVCEVGTVEVPALMAVESYATVHQLVSTIRGRLREGLGALDAVAACFPGGSMTGAPKRRTLDIIDGLEQRPRGVYSGALGFVSASGTADLAIVIRTVVTAGGTTRIGAGGAIVLDSDPDAEYEEMLLKLRSALPG